MVNLFLMKKSKNNSSLTEARPSPGVLLRLCCSYVLAPMVDSDRVGAAVVSQLSVTYTELV